MKPTLLILAAGMGSRYGGLKQIDGIGPNQEPIIEYLPSNISLLNWMIQQGYQDKKSQKGFK